MVSTRTYLEDPSFNMPQVYLSDENYAEAMESLVVVCADALFINRLRRSVFLAARRADPFMGPWLIGGRIFAGENEKEGVRRCMERETGVDAESGRFNFFSMNRYISKLRKQLPKEKGSDTLAYTFFIELTPAELAWASQHLDPEEYDRAYGIQEFDRERLVREKVRQPIIDMYDLVFNEKDPK
jgi:hypothetical protein